MNKYKLHLAAIPKLVSHPEHLVLFPRQDKVMLGTDYPFPLGELEPGSLIESMDELDNTLKVKNLT